MSDFTRRLTDLFVNERTMEDISKWDLTNTVCRQADPYVLSRWHWEVTLNNGEIVFQDDYREDMEEPMAWRRLKKYCLQNSLFITKLKLRFRSHVETPLPDNQDGYYFRHNAFGSVGLSPNPRDGFSGTLEYAILGFIDRVDKKLKVQRWKVPELLKSPFLEGHLEEERSIDPLDPALIPKETK